MTRLDAEDRTEMRELIEKITHTLKNPSHAAEYGDLLVRARRVFRWLLRKEGA